MSGGPFQHILITGASSGLGKALALFYAAPNVHLYLTGRERNRLDEVARLCQERGATTQTSCIDVTSRDALSEWITSFSKLDLIIANAGISGGTSGTVESEDQTQSIMQINVNGVLNTILPGIEILKKNNNGGQIAIVSSMASFLPLSGCPAYAASKACVRAFGEALRFSLSTHRIGVTVICPGYIKTPLTDANNFHMPFLMSSEKAAYLIGKKLHANPARIIFPLRMYLATCFVRLLPFSIKMWLINKFPAK